MSGQKKILHSPAEITIGLIKSKWKVLILRELRSGTKRFGELLRNLGGVSQKVLTQNLRALEDDGLVCRKVYAEVPPRVDYSMTVVALDLHNILVQMREWGIKYNTRYARKIKNKTICSPKCPHKHLHKNKTLP
ncbi:MAG: helix-turn-helix transcriptional regulator [Proteobacteria bacterium]|nr:helix-turn-helix transcriptional regulator [Pseudomonadota bacterium]